MPASGFVEMFLAAASTASIQEFPIILEDIKILSSLVVENAVAREIHTVLTFSEEDKNIIKLSAFGREVSVFFYLEFYKLNWKIISRLTLKQPLFGIFILNP
jgi:hypothetical protein